MASTCLARNTYREEITYQITETSIVTIRPRNDVPGRVYDDMGLLLKISAPWRKCWARKTVLLPGTADDVAKLQLALANVLVWAGYDDQEIVDTLSGWLAIRKEKWEKHATDHGYIKDIPCPYEYDPYVIGQLAMKARRDVKGRMHGTKGTGARHGELRYKICAELARRPWKSWGPRELALKLGESKAAVQRCLHRLAKEKEVQRVGRGKYRCKEECGYVPYDLHVKFARDQLYCPKVPF